MRLLAVILAIVGPAAGALAADSIATPRACPAANRIADVARATETLPRGDYVVVDRHRSGEFVRVKGPTGDRWVRTDCAGSAGPAPGLDDERPEPFFDHVDDGPGDLRPPPPRLDAFDRAVLEVCGPWGGRPSRQAFADLMAGQPDIVAAAGGVDALVHAWFGADGFAHVFCGEPGSDRLGGFHWEGRYLQAQESGWAGISRACGIREKDGPILTFGVRFRTPGGGRATQCPKGYVQGQSARDLLLAATRAWRAAPTRDGACLAPVEGARQGRAVVVLKGGALRTWYGDATPDRTLPACGS